MLAGWSLEAGTRWPDGRLLPTTDEKVDVNSDNEFDNQFFLDALGVNQEILSFRRFASSLEVAPLSGEITG
eukprot:6558203-Heterocapsa_arctica.AAC.1